MRYLLIVLLTLLSTVAVFSQDAQSQSQQLNQRVAAFYQSRNYDDAIPLAERVVEIERKVATTKNLVNALENLAEIKQSRFKSNVGQLNAGTVESAKLRDISAKVRNDAETSETHLREAIRLADADSAAFREQRIAMRTKLAWILYSYKPPDPETKIEYGKSGRDIYAMQARARLYKRVDEAEKLYQEASTISSAGAGPNDVATLQIDFNYAEFALATGNLEGGINRLEKCIAEVDRRFGKTSTNLLPLLDLYIKALVATSQEDQAFEAVSRLVRVTGKSATLPKTLLNISLRADKAFLPSNSSGIEETARANKETVALATRRANMNAALDRMLVTSTLNNAYYGASGTTNIVRVPVMVVIDEVGKVVEAEAMTTDKGMKIDAEKAVREWRFRPFIAAGQPRKIRGYVEPIIFTDQKLK